jgi:hypothetical protein
LHDRDRIRAMPPELCENGKRRSRR